MIDKIFTSVAAAVAGIGDGSTVMIGGFGTAGMPSELIDGLLETDARELTIVEADLVLLPAFSAKGETHLLAAHFDVPVAHGR